MLYIVLLPRKKHIIFKNGFRQIIIKTVIFCNRFKKKLNSIKLIKIIQNMCINFNQLVYTLQKQLVIVS